MIDDGSELGELREMAADQMDELEKELAALKEWKEDVCKTLLENAALLEEGQRMILAEKKESRRLRQAIKDGEHCSCCWNYACDCIAEIRRGDDGEANE